MKNIVSDQPCPSCREMGRDSTGNHLMVFADGNKHCNRCGYSEIKETGDANQMDDNLRSHEAGTGTPAVVEKFNPTPFLSYPIKDIPDRKLSRETCEYFGVRSTLSQKDGRTVEDLLIPIKNEKQDITGFKTRLKTPLASGAKYLVKGQTSDIFFGADEAQASLKSLPSASRTLYVCEGELDALALYQTLKQLSKSPDKNPPVVALRNGADTAARAMSVNKDLIEQAKKIVFVFDNDEAGRKASEQAARVVGSKAHVAKLPMKDACDLVIAGREKELKKAALSAEKYMPASLVSALDILDEILETPTYGLSYPWPSLTDLTYGLKTGLLIGIAAGTGIGKTDWFTQLAAHLIQEHKEKVGIFFLEAPPKKTYKILAGKMAHTPFHRPDVHYDPVLLQQIITDEINDNCYAYNHFGYKSWADIKADIRTMTGYGYKYFIVDPLTALIAQEGEEYKALNKMMEEMASMTQELDITIFYASHLNQPDRSSRSHEEGGRVKESQLTGSRAMIRWSHYIFGIQRNKHAVDEDGNPDMIARNTSTFVLLKDREHGKTGEFPIYYNADTTDYLEPSTGGSESDF